MASSVASNTNQAKHWAPASRFHQPRPPTSAHLQELPVHALDELLRLVNPHARLLPTRPHAGVPGGNVPDCLIVEVLGAGGGQVLLPPPGSGDAEAIKDDHASDVGVEEGASVHMCGAAALVRAACSNIQAPAYAGIARLPSP
jgi:hypothetical protein